ncbi:unnamed protein product [Phytophthora fragariaefolia]|uniref:Unnamed protein product n=1 Tax=Phytophthora fragariaefolia TaxID=1490495 RepID=A0A9W7CZK8_9STRA|nr:unnamed protein product [Phytophthora fragariaefolia]
MIPITRSDCSIVTKRKGNDEHLSTSTMGKRREWSESDTIQLCRSWLEISEDAVQGEGQKSKTYSSRLYNHWQQICLETMSAADEHSEIAVIHRWKKMQPQGSGQAGEVVSRRRR